MNSSENTQPLSEDATPATTEHKPRHRRNLLIGLGAAAALIAMGGGAYAVGAAMDDDDDDDRVGVQVADHDGAHRDASDDVSDDDGTVDERGESSSSNAAAPASDPATLRAAAEQAIAHVDGTGVTSIDVKWRGYEFDVLRTDGTEVEVFIGPDGAVRTDDDDDDRSDDPVLDLAQLGDILAAAQSAASAETGMEGTVDSISTSDDASKRYEVDLDLDDRRDVEVELTADLKTVTVEIDD
ncbi:hypothetical protein WDU99_11735 [Microbacterium sp. Mu-80]|uniref:PepSY domain-containing protein n=1 Tax=Microbacterium bandirmense TaxID=3122050 RepID=A0ABU8LCT7_9MICO